MKTVDLLLFLSVYTFTVAATAVAQVLRQRQFRFLLPALVAIAFIPLNTFVGSHIDPSMDYFGLLRYLIRERDVSSVIALLMGFAAAFAVTPCYLAARGVAGKPNRDWLVPTVLAMSTFVVVSAGQAFLWKDILGITRHPVKMLHAAFNLEKIASLAEQPLRLAVDNGDVLICYDYFKKHGAIGGVILRLRPDPATGNYSPKTVAEAPFLIRPYGLAVRNGDLYVSRSGFFPRAVEGTVSYESTGAVTQLKDLDGDGYYEFSHDVISNLPGMRAPDTMQQNNGIAFAPDGSLFVACAGVADRTLDEHPWGGTILRFGPDFGDAEVFARGFRNPWGIAIGPDDALFATDSDVDQNPGDEINHVIQGAHYGHPFVIPNEPDVTSEGFQDPILVGERETVFLGITYATSPALPVECRNCLYVTDFRQNRVLRIRLVKHENTYRVAAVDPFASIPSPVDIASTPSGDFFVISRRTQNVYRIRPKRTAAE